MKIRLKSPHWAHVKALPMFHLHLPWTKLLDRTDGTKLLGRADGTKLLGRADGTKLLGRADRTKLLGRNG
ncbi:uncharacterized protein SETTUDRAFT_163000 [Exserohilum turcica Et28A]|uniref:Uncharacterized protein n=1 Tax=Exserohilum turcicum (strain 28A) TaxID=671987 RepID=R0KFG9_EXST2|nr:uncharacterized protein SETTUDRAFT_163000 [Exserohilum turcica Et28A]EOA86857.1 hypothetical protein SETTUDRAFT_163000 [Exserohilum turcica Et28A]